MFKNVANQTIVGFLIQDNNNKEKNHEHNL